MTFRRILLLLLLAVVFMAGMPMASATSEAMNSFNEEYSTNDTRLATCTVCHGSNVESLNPYGTAYRENGGDFVAIEPLDSDGDDFTNLDEIDALTFPGDPDDYPEPTAEVPRGTENESETMDNDSESAVEEDREQVESEENVSNTSDQQQTPGFEAVIASVGVLMAIYLFRRK